MSTTYDAILINANVLLFNGRTQICKVIKQYIYTKYKHHLIGVIYYDALTNYEVNILKELSASYRIKDRISYV